MDYMNEIKSRIDIDSLVSRPVDVPYPHIYLGEISRYAATVVKKLPEGNLPILATHKEVTKIVARVSRSAYNVNKLIRVSDVTLKVNEDTSIKIEDIRDYMEALIKWT